MKRENKMFFPRHRLVGDKLLSKTMVIHNCWSGSKSVGRREPEFNLQENWINHKPKNYYLSTTTDGKNFTHDLIERIWLSLCVEQQ